MADEVDELVAWLRGVVGDPGATIEERRALFADLCSHSMPLPDDVTFRSCRVGGVPGEWVSVGGEKAEGIVMYLHGGGYSFGSPETHRELVGRIARASGCRVLAIDYRLAPEHPFPAALEDIAAAYLGLLADGASPAEIVLAGDSAGGALAVSLLLSLRDDGRPLPAGACLISPWTDLTLTGASLDGNAALDPLVRRSSTVHSVRRYLGADTDPATPLASPIFADLRGLPPLLIHVGQAEALLDDSLRLVERACADGVDVTLRAYPRMIHMFPFFAKRLEAGRRAIEEIGAFVRERLADAYSPI